MQKIVQTAAQLLFRTKNTDKIPVVSGSNTVNCLFDDIKCGNYRSVFIASGRTIRNKGMLDKLISKLEKSGIKTVIFSDIVPDPTIENVENGLAILKENNCDCIIAAGGGSVLDCAKVIALRATNPSISVRMMSFYLMPCRKSMPIYVIPTTSGTGSEVTYFSIITDSDKKQKLAVLSDQYMPEKIIFDYELLRHVPLTPTVYSGLDALTHSIESYISTYSKTFKRDVASAPAVCKNIFRYLPEAAADPDSKEARLKMAAAAYMAGINFRRAAVGYVHAIAHRLGENYHIPHGCACAAVLPLVLERSLPDAEPRLKELAVKSGIAESAEEFIEKIRTLEKQLGIPEHFEEINKADYPVMIKRIISEASLQGCPKKLSADEIRSILDTLKGRS